MPAERRTYRRLPMGATVGFQELSFSSVPEPTASVYADISAGGLLITSPRAFPLGALLRLEIRVPGWGRHQGGFGPAHDQDLRPLVAVGEVVRTETLGEGEFELGVKFLNVYPDDQVALRKFIDASLPAHE